MRSCHELRDDTRPQLALVKPRFASDFDVFAALWISRLCCGYSAALREVSDGISSEEIRQMIGLTPREGKLLRAETRALLKKRAIELAAKRPNPKSSFVRNVKMLGDLIRLTELQKEILAFALLSLHHPYLSAVVENIRTSSLDALFKLLTIALNVSENDIRKALRNDGPLLGKQVICIEESLISHSLNLAVPDNLQTALLSDADSIHELMSAFLEKAPASTLTREAFAYLEKEMGLLLPYLGNALAQGVSGVNVLIYGPPGTGKTEFVRCLAALLEKPLYQVRANDDQGKAISGPDRMASFQFSQSFLEQSGALILFDEIEDVFPADEHRLWPIVSNKTAPPGKMFINRVLESNPVPAVWVANAVDHIDPAYLRRFDFSFELGAPPVSVRRGMLLNYLRGQRVSSAALEYLAQQEDLTPAQIEKATRVLKLSRCPSTQREAMLLYVLENSQRLLGQKLNSAQVTADAHYQLDYLNADCDLNRLVTQFKAAEKCIGALCFYGPPGTGKTALAHYIARQLELPIQARRASDILGPYVGETEQKIALMFRQAQEDGALLLLDEADSFLSDRQGARNTWEVSAVNEMLTQMECFDGLFICSTNLMQRLDAASLRRFALKIRFDYLCPEQRWRLFKEHVPKRLKWSEADYRAALDRMSNLTPGDFATIRRQAALFHLTLTPEELLNRLQQECSSKTDRAGKCAIGFIHAS